MTSPLIGCNQLIDVSTDAIHVSINRRKEPVLAQETIKKQPSTLEVWGKINSLKICSEDYSAAKSNDYVKLDVQPIFFEQSDYIIKAKSLKGNKLTFDHIDKNIRNSVNNQEDDELDRLYGVINFGNEVGYSNLEFYDDQGNRLLLQIEVFPSKLSYKEDYVAIRNDINEMVEAAAIDFINSTYVKGTLSNTRNNVPAIFYELLNQLFEKFYKASLFILSKPNHKLVTEHNVLPCYKLKETDVKTLKWIENHSSSIKANGNKIKINNALAIQKTITYNTIENQLVKFILTKVKKKLIDFKRKYVSSISDENRKIIERIGNMVAKINRLLKNPIFEEVSDIREIDTMSLVFQMSPGYRDFYRYFKMIQRGVSFSGEVFNFSMKETSTLYEYWCFIKLVNIMKKHFTLIDKEHDIIKSNRKGITVTLSKDKSSEVEFLDVKTGDKFTLKYNRNEYPSETVKQIPDNVLSLEKGKYAGNKTSEYKYVFDAKYKIEMCPDAYYPDENPGPKITDINTMHRYRDAIVSNNGDQHERLMFGAYVLFPYPYDENKYKEHQFYKSIDSVNIGGLPFLPGKTELAEELLTKLVGESDESAFERSVLPKGTENRLKKVDWEKKDVLVGVVRNAEQWKYCYEKRCYYIPVKNVSINKHQINYIAIYQSINLFKKEAGVQYYGEVTRTQILPRKKINNLESHSSPNEKYYCFDIREWKGLDEPIAFEASWVSYKPRFTNLFLLQNCNRTYELFNIKSEEDFRLVAELKRIKKWAEDLNADVEVQDKPNLFVKVNDTISVYIDKGYIYVYDKGVEKLKKEIELFKKTPSSIFFDIQNVIEASLESDYPLSHLAYK